MVASLIHGKVGFFKGSGLFVNFASESGIPEMKFDTSSEDADWIADQLQLHQLRSGGNELGSIPPP